MNRRTLLMFGIAGLAAVGAGLLLPSLGGAENISTLTLSGEALASAEDIVLVDIRRAEEWKQTGVIEGAHLVTYAGAQDFLAKVGPLVGKGQKLALICRSGNRTSQAARQIAPLVDFEVIDVAGGMLRVTGEGYAPVAPTKSQGCASCN